MKKTTDFTDVNSSFTENVLTSIGVILIIVGISSSIILISKYRFSFLEVIYVLTVGTVTGFLLIGFAQILYYLRTIKDILKAKNNE